MSHKSTLGKYDNLACLQIPALSGKKLRWMKRRNVSDTFAAGFFRLGNPAQYDRFGRASAKAKPQNIVANKNRE